MSESRLTKQRLIADLTKSPHGKLTEYLKIGVPASQDDPEFFAHLTAWAAGKSEVRDVRVALPVIGLNTRTPEFLDNALAHLAMLDPRMFTRAVAFARETKFGGSRVIRRLVERYLRETELDTRRWEHVAVQHRHTLKGLYAKHHVKPSALADEVIVKGLAPAGSIFATIKQLATMTPEEAAGAIISKRIPFLIASGALKDRMKSPDVVMALIKAMSPTELVTNTKRLEKLGVRTDPALRATFEEALAKAATSKKGRPTLKTTRAADAQTDDNLKAKLQALQEKQLDRLSIEGNWLVLADKSGSMQSAIEAGRQVAAVLSRAVKGTVNLLFFDTTPRGFDATGKTLDEITMATRHVSAGGGTSIGCGLQWALDQKADFDGIVVVSDGGENVAPYFDDVYGRYAKFFDKTPPVYLYLFGGESNVFTARCQRSGIDVQEYDLRGGVDYYSLPNLVQTMRANRYSLIDEVLATPLLTLDGVLTRTTDLHVLAGAVKVRA